MPSPEFRAGDLVEFIPSAERDHGGVWWCENPAGDEVAVPPGTKALVLYLSDVVSHQEEYFFSYKILVDGVLLEASDIMFRKITIPQ